MLLHVLASGALLAGHAASDSPAVRTATVRASELPSIRRVLHGTPPTEVPTCAGTSTDAAILIEAIIRETGTGAGDVVSADPEVVFTPAIAARDDLAYRLLGVGYSARETADVVSGRITRRALDTAMHMIMAGLGREAAESYLDREYVRPDPAAPPNPLPESPPPANSPPPSTPPFRASFDGLFDRAIEYAANAHHVDAALVRAMIAVESAFDPLARSGAGALGPMQLMPATARSLGVNPGVPGENIEGGVRYFSQLLTTFGGVELALVAYNGGPGFARRYARGETALYGETRDYVRRVLSHLGASR
jgi:soluble lytic murein transglycosylase-like protein